jgi:hypothetical protein
LFLSFLCMAFSHCCTKIRYAIFSRAIGVRLPKHQQIKKLKMYTYRFIATVFILSIVTGYTSAGENNSYLDINKPIIAIKNVNEQAEAWAVCAASYDVIAEIISAKAANAKQMRDFANGAELAVMISIVVNDIDDDITSKKFASLWAFAKVAAKSIPETKLTMMMAEAELLGDKGVNQFIEKVTNTVKTCMGNLEGQQTYIETWRELAKSGLLELPQ